MKFSRSPRLTLLIITAMFLLPLLLAWLMYNGSLDFKPASTRNLGTLVEPPVSVDWVGAVILPSEADLTTEYKPDISVFDQHWVILHAVPADCDDSCLKNVADLRQIHRASGRHTLRIRLALLLEDSRLKDQAENLSAIYPQFHLLQDSSGFLREALRGIVQGFPGQTTVAGSVYLLDPRGNIMMYYRAGSDPNYIKRDLTRLLN